MIGGYLLTEHGNSNWKMVGTVMMMASGSNLLATQGLGAAFAVGSVRNAATTALTYSAHRARSERQLHRAEP